MASAIVKSLVHPQELMSLIDFQLLGGKNRLFPPNNTAELGKSMQRCYFFLNKTSRSFAAVIQALHPDLRPAICLFYLILRGLDTVEDDMSLEPKLKKQLLIEFHEKLFVKGWTFDGSGPEEKDRQLLVEFDVVIDEFLKLKPEFKDVIADITMKMGAGMAKYMNHNVETVADYNEYCHYVAGLVGIGLSRLFSASGLEDAEVGRDEYRANSMGLFLQKTNIIRDYLEDLHEGRTWWPREIWSKYSSKLEYLARDDHRQVALDCLNHMVWDALQHVPDVFTYMTRLKEQTVFNFCAIPQVMAIATLAACFNNPNVFRGVVKIRKGEAVSLMLKAQNMTEVYKIFYAYAKRMQPAVPLRSGKTAALHERLDYVVSEVEQHVPSDELVPASSGVLVSAALVATAAGLLWAFQQRNVLPFA